MVYKHRHWSSSSKLFLFNNRVFGHWQLNPCRFSPGSAAVAGAGGRLGLPILKRSKCRQTGTYTVPQFPGDESGLLIPPRWCSHSPAAVLAAACWGVSASLKKKKKTTVESQAKPSTALGCPMSAWLMAADQFLLLAVSSMGLLTAWLYHGLAWKEELETALIQDTGWFADQGTLTI